MKNTFTCGDPAIPRCHFHLKNYQVSFDNLFHQSDRSNKILNLCVVVKLQPPTHVLKFFNLLSFNFVSKQTACSRLISEEPFQTILIYINVNRCRHSFCLNITPFRIIPINPIQNSNMQSHITKILLIRMGS